jgi:DeoR/GlpR family transcriptional regulator of sugar metabolism
MSQPQVRFPQDRQRRMYDLVVEHRRLSTSELAGLLDISLPTIRRDLTVLEQAGLISRTHGGVMAQGAGDIAEPLFLEKLRLRQNLKRRIADKAAAMVEDGDVVILDSGTTALAIARLLAGRPVAVVALDLKVAEAAAVGATDVRIVGGRLRNGYFSITGEGVAAELAGLRADLFFLSADAIDEDGVSNTTVEEADVKRAALTAARRSVLVADHSKLGQRGPVPVCGLAAVEGFITDRTADGRIDPYRRLVAVTEV